MSRTRSSPWRVAGAGASGVLLWAAFPPLDRGTLGWIALVPLLIALRGLRPRHALGLGWLTGTLAFGLTTSWVVTTLTRFTTLPAGIAVLLHAFMALILGGYVGAWAAGVASAAACGRALWLMAPAWWVVTEWLRGWFPIGFPWTRLGESQHGALALAQLVAVTGIHGLSALVVLGNVAVAALLRPAGMHVPWRAIGMVAALVTVVELGGTWRMRALGASAPTSTLRLALVPGHVDQDRKWDPQEADRIFDHYVRATRAAGASRPDLVVWPETATPFVYDDRPEGVVDLVRTINTPLLFGTPTATRISDAVHRTNRVVLVGADGTERVHYDKRVLVPFGEYVPARWLFPFVRPLVGQEDGLLPGTVPTVFDVSSARVGVLLCYEVIAPSLARALIAHGATVLVNPSNDAWFATETAVAQAIASAQFRAIEHRVPLVRVANGGPTLLIVPDGRIIWRANPSDAAWHAVSVPISPVGTLYTRTGDLAVWMSGAVVVWALASRRSRELTDTG